MFPIEIPSLAERKEDIPILVTHILNEIRENGSKSPIFEESALTALKEYVWPGNIRELKNLIERAAIIFGDKKINGKNVRENLLKINLPDFKEEKDVLWDLTSDFAEVEEKKELKNHDDSSMPHPNHYKKWFEYLDKIDLRDI